MDLTKKEKINHIIEILVVILMGLSALLTAWATWIGSLHGGNQATNYTTSNNLASEGNSEYNAGVQSMTQDMMLWNDVSDMQLDVMFAEEQGDAAEYSKACYKLYCKLNDNLSEAMAAKIGWEFTEGDPEVVIAAWLEKEEALSSLFTEQEYVDTYFTTANDLLTQSTEVLEQGKQDNKNGDTYGLVTVMFSVALFLLGMISTLESVKNKYVLLGISVLLLLIAAGFMCTIPMPTGFSIASFFGVGA